MQYASGVPFDSSGECFAILQRLNRNPDIMRWLFMDDVTGFNTFDKDNLTPFILRYQVEYLEPGRDTRLGFHCARNAYTYVEPLPDAVKGIILPPTIYVPIHQKSDLTFFLGCSPDVVNESSACKSPSRMVFVHHSAPEKMEWFTAFLYKDWSYCLAHCVIHESGSFVGSFILLPRSYINFAQKIDIGCVLEWLQIVSCPKATDEPMLISLEDSEDPSSEFYNAFLQSGILKQSFHDSAVTYFSPEGKSLGYTSFKAQLEVLLYSPSKSTEIPLCEACCNILGSSFETFRVKTRQSEHLNTVQSDQPGGNLQSDTENLGESKSKLAPTSRADISDPREHTVVSSSEREGTSDQRKKRKRDTTKPDGKQDVVRARRKDEKPWVCDTCGATFTRKFDRDRHISILHLKQRNYICTACTRSFQQQAHLNTHVMIVHMNIRRYQCEICKLRFGIRSNLKSHRKSVHGIDSLE